MVVEGEGGYADAATGDRVEIMHENILVQILLKFCNHDIYVN